MNTKEQLKNDIINAMKEKNKEILNTLRSVKGAVQLEVINNKKEETDELYLDVINKQIKLRKDSINEFIKAGRNDLAESYNKEIEILSKYMPSQLTDIELDNIINETIEKVGNDVKSFGLIMKEITPRVKNRCDMSKLSSLIKDKLN